jgi:hypothetical protein
MGPTLHGEYDGDSAAAAFGPSRRRADYCGGHFVVLDGAVLGFLTLRQDGPKTTFTSPTELTWRPPESYDTPGEELPWLPTDVREIADRHLFVRPSTSQPYVYVGPAHLGSYSYRPGSDGDVEAGFSLKQKLPRELWLRFGGYAGWQVDLNHSMVHVPVDDDVAFDRLLRAALAEQSSHLIMTRYEEDSMHLFLNAERGWLMYLREPGDSGLYIRDPAFQRDDDDVYYQELEEDFECTCGISMTFPRSQTLPRDQAADVVREFFAARGSLPESINWFEM